MTQSTLRFLIGGLLTVGLLASLARGDDKQRPPELLPAPRCAACDKTSDCCSPGAPCCQENSGCCTQSNAKASVFSVGVMPAGVDFNRNWGSSSQWEEACQSDEAKKRQIAELIVYYHALYQGGAQFRAIKAELDPGNCPIADWQKLVTSANQNCSSPPKVVKEKRLASLMTLYHTFYKEHKYREAEICAIKAQELDPDNYVVGAAVHTAHMAMAHQEYQDIAKDREDYMRRQGGGAEITGPVVNAVGPVAIDSQAQTISMTTGRGDKEREINRKLDSKVTGFDYRDTPLQEILDDLAGWSQINIVPDVQALKDANISLSLPITMKLEGASLSSALKLVLNSAQLVYEMKNGELVIVPKEKALTQYQRRVFPVLDLVAPDSNCLTSFLSMLTENRKESPEAALIKFIQDTIEPQSWSKSGGLATIEFFPLGKAFVINQTSDVQEEVQQLLNALRLLQDPQVADAKCDSCPVVGCDVPANTSEKQAPSKLETRVYTVSDLVCPVPNMESREEDHAGLLIEMIEYSIEPQSWKLDESTQDRPGTIVFYQRGKGLIVTQTPEVQERVHGFLEALHCLQGQTATKENSVSSPKTYDKPAPSSCEVMTVGAQFNQLWDPACQQTQPMPAPAVPLVMEFAPPRLSNSELALQPLPFVTRDANGNTRMGFAYGSEATGASPLPPPVPTFRVPPAVACEMNLPPTTFQFGRMPEAPVPVAPSNVTPYEPPARVYRDQAVAPIFKPISPASVEEGRQPEDSETAQVEPPPAFRGYRVSIRSGVPIAVPALGPVPVALDLGVPIRKGPEWPQASSPVFVAPQMAAPCMTQACVPPAPPVAPQMIQLCPQIQQPEVTDRVALPMPASCQATQLRAVTAFPAGTLTYPDARSIPVGYMPATPGSVDSRSNTCWTLKVHPDGDRPAMSAHCGTASVVCTNLAVKWKQSSTLLFTAEKNCVRVRGNDFEAEAEAAECHESEGKLVLSGNVTFSRYEAGKCECTVKAQHLEMNSEGLAIKGSGSLKGSLERPGS